MTRISRIQGSGGFFAGGGLETASPCKGGSLIARATLGLTRIARQAGRKQAHQRDANHQERDLEISGGMHFTLASSSLN